MNSLDTKPNPNEGLLAAIAHFFGLLPALMVWATQKNRSRFVREQARQAIVFDVVAAATISLVVGGLFVGALAAAGLGIADIAVLGSQNPTAGAARAYLAVLDAIPFLIGIMAILVMISAFILRVIAAIQSLRRQNFRYPWLGKLVEPGIQG